MPDPDFVVSCERRGAVVLAAVRGRIDHTNAEAFRNALWPTLEGCGAKGEPMVLDLHELEYISSAGLRVLMLAARRAAEVGGVIAVAVLQPVVREIFQITRFDRVFRVFEDLPSAVAALSPPAAA